ncbi:MAG TPA: hypothetical protein V6C86_23260 [Oculatellaceae cyanobacterium]
MNKIHSLLSGSLTAIAVFGACSVYAWAEDPAISQSLNKIEDRLLEHDYRSETDEQRLQRLENFVFGGLESGTVKERIARLNSALAPVSAAEDPTVATNKTTAASSSPKPAAPHYDSSDYGTYPRVAELEQQVFGKTFVTDALPVRISRLETKEFGHASDKDDLADRMDKLDKLLAPTSALMRPMVAQTKPANNAMAYNSAPAAASGYNNGYGFGPGASDDESKKPAIENPFTPGSPDVKSIEQRTSSLEKFVFGREHYGKPLGERVARLEKKLVPYEHHADKDLPTRVDHLWTMLAAANTSDRSPLATE